MRAFVAIDLSGSEADGFLDLQERLAVGRSVPAGNLHLTLAFLDEQPESALEALHEELEEVRHPAFELRFRGVDLFGGVRSRALAVLAEQEPALLDLQQAIKRCLHRVGISSATRRYRPHVTLARFKDGGQNPERLQAAISRGGTSEIGPLLVTHFSLFQSTLTSAGAIHEVLCDYPLQVFGDGEFDGF
ncbi:2'-5' RNA ligase [Shimia isoporae]|uniref:RNA 2',3'-cyclic phosphodiesterase n=1 Tax=Shimia isoporae TaxID=647720 RepID=A0A4R1N2G0_9RHOB|nr:RNA 2',3'-cyclic phosphodiesterase [Shimia isoporae]TCL00398.1 2'-5' RNA ligase [Shimia isoporae]